MLKNRSQKDLNDNITSIDAREKEKEYFKAHPVFRNVDSRLYGINQLSKKLTLLLVSRIQCELVPMKTEVDRQLNETRAELRGLSTQFTSSGSGSNGNGSGSAAMKTTSDRQKLLVAIMQVKIKNKQ